MPLTEKLKEISSYINKCEDPSRSPCIFKSTVEKEQGHHSIVISYRYAVYRWLQFVAHVLIMLGALLELYTRSVRTYGFMFYAKWPLYLSSWVIIGNVAQSLLGAIIVTKGYNHCVRGGQLPSPNDSPSDRIYGVPPEIAVAYRFMYSIALNFAVFMVFGYWVLMGGFPKDVSLNDKAMFGGYGLSGFLMLMDLVVVQHKYKMKTGVYSLAILVAYLTVTWVHFKTGSLDAHQKNPYIYPGLDWSKPKIVADHALRLVFILVVLNCSVLWWLCQLKRRIMNKFNPYRVTPQGNHDCLLQSTETTSQAFSDSHDPHHEQHGGDNEPAIESAHKKKHM